MVKRVSFLIIMLVVLSLTIPLNKTYAEGTTIQVYPPTSTVEMGTTFTVNVTVTAVEDLAVWEVQLFYRNAILNCTGAQEGPFLKQGGNTFFASLINNAYNATHGWLLLGSTLIGPVPGVYGSGTLATITFQAKTIGETALHFEGTTLKDSSPPPRNPIPHTSTDGTVVVTTPAITAVQVFPPTSLVREGTTFTVNVAVTAVKDLAVWEVQLYYRNAILNCTGAQEGPFLKQGGNTFFASLINNAYNATHGWLLLGSTLIGPVPGVNGSGTLATITFQAKTGGETALHLEGTTLKDSSPPPRHPISHTSADGVVIVLLLGDCAGAEPMEPPWWDGHVLWQDLLVVLVGYGATPADPRWTIYYLARADFNSDNQIFWQDLLAVLVNYGRYV